MSDLDRIFDNHKNTVMAILEDAKSVEKCRLEIEFALEKLYSALMDHDCDEECGHGPMDYMPVSGTYVIEARNLNEETRIEKFIEELNTNPYAP